MNLDYYLFQQLNNLGGQNFWVGKTSIFFASYFQYILIAALFVFWLFGKTGEEKKQNRMMVIFALISAGVARLGFVELIRFFYFRPRPFTEHQIFQLINHETSGSFPSGHAAFFFALATVVYLYQKKVYPERSRRAGHWFLFGAFLIGLARIFAGVHYPLDILAGALVGIFTGWLIKILVFRYSK